MVTMVMVDVVVGDVCRGQRRVIVDVVMAVGSSGGGGGGTRSALAA